MAKKIKCRTTGTSR